MRHALLAALAPLAALARAEEPATTLDPVEVTGTLPADLRLTGATTVTSYSGGLLADIGAATWADIAPLVPGLFISEQSVANTSFNLRGITTDNNDPRAGQRVSIFQDGVPLSNNATRSAALFDLERVDVLKGPQASAFGRAAQIGAVSLVSRRPEAAPSAGLSAGFGSNNSRTAGGHANIPLAGDKLLARFAFTLDRTDGYVDNLLASEDLQGRDTLALRGTLRWKPSAQTTADLIVGHQRDTPPGVAFKNMVIPTSRGDTDPFSATELTRGDLLGATRDVTSLTALVTHTLSPDWTAASTTGWRDSRSNEQFDADGSRFFLIEAGEKVRARQFNQDLRLDYDSGDRFTAALGASVFWEKASQQGTIETDQNTLVLFLTGAPPPFPLPALYRERSANYAEMLAGDLYGEVGYKLTDRLKVGASLRVTHEDRTAGYRANPASTPSIPILPTAGGGNSLFAPTGGLIEADRSDVGWAGGISASYELTPRHTLYAGVSRGRRPPVTTFDLGAPFGAVDLDEETVVHYEIGLKGATPNRRVAYSVSVFQYDYEHFQTDSLVGPPPGVSTPIDAGRARGRGFEVSAQGLLTDHLTAFASYGFTDTEFADRDEDGNPQAFAGNSFRLTARHVVALGATLRIPVDNVGTFFVTPAYEYKSKHYFEDDNAKSGGTLYQGGYSLVHLRLGYRTPDNRWEIVLWARNLLDEDYLIDAGNIGADFGLPTSVRGSPTTIGLNVTARF